jgi:hypothetical protein
MENADFLNPCNGRSQHVRSDQDRNHFTTQGFFSRIINSDREAGFSFHHPGNHNRLIAEPEELLNGDTAILHDARKDLRAIQTGLYGKLKEL